MAATLLLLACVFAVALGCPDSHLSKINVTAIKNNVGLDSSPVTLTVSSTTLSFVKLASDYSHSHRRYSGMFVNVTFTGYPTPSKDEWIGLYLEEDDIKTTAPIAYQLAIHDPSYNTTGSGSLIEFYLIDSQR